MHLGVKVVLCRCLVEFCVYALTIAFEHILSTVARSAPIHPMNYSGPVAVQCVLAIRRSCALLKLLLHKIAHTTINITPCTRSIAQANHRARAIHARS